MWPRHSFVGIDDEVMAARRNDCAAHERDEFDGRIACRVVGRERPTVCAVLSRHSDRLVRVVVQFDIFVARAVNPLRCAEGRAAEAELADQHVARIDRIGDRALPLPVGNGCVARRVREVDEEGLVAFGESVGVDGDTDRLARLACREHQLRRWDRDVIAGRGGRAVRGRIVHRDRTGRRRRERDSEDGGRSAGGRFRDEHIIDAHADRRRVVVLDRAAALRAHGVRQVDEELLVRLEVGIAVDEHGYLHGRIGRAEVERAAV